MSADSMLTTSSTSLGTYSIAHKVDRGVNKLQNTFLCKTLREYRTVGRNWANVGVGLRICNLQNWRNMICEVFEISVTKFSIQSK